MNSDGIFATSKHVSVQSDSEKCEWSESGGETQKVVDLDAANENTFVRSFNAPRDLAGFDRPFIVVARLHYSAIIVNQAIFHKLILRQAVFRYQPSVQ
jgi:hypothetical protein